MDVNQLQIHPRVRNHWSAVDIGVCLARQWYRDLFWGWFIGASVLLFILTACFFWAPWIIFLGFWWLKPLLDRVPLYMGSRKLFGQDLTLKGALKQGAPALRRDFLALLTWRRFSPSRSFDQPITVLENLKGARRQRRLQQLHLAGFPQSCWLTWVCFALEGAGVLALYALVYLMIPEAYQVRFEDLMAADGFLAELLSAAASVVVASVVAPFYVMGGFLLYLNRRIALEGWDIELQFRALAQRLAERERQLSAVPSAANLGFTGGEGARRVLLPFTVMIIGIGGLFWAGDSVLATHRADGGPVTARMKQTVSEIAPQPNSARFEVRQNLEVILADEDFHRMAFRGEWQLRDKEAQAPTVYSAWQIRIVEWLEGLGFFTETDRADVDRDGFSWILSIANILEFLLWGVVVVLVCLLLYRYRGVLRKALPEYKQRVALVHQPPTAEIQGMDIRPETLPDDVPSQVRSLLSTGHSRQALALLYRASLSRLAHHWHVPFARHHTEHDCLTLVLSTLAPKKLGQQAHLTTNGGGACTPGMAREHPNVPTSQVAQLFANIVQLWIRCAYGHIAPDQVKLESALVKWSEVFDLG